MAENNRDGYISAVRKEGFGDLDIYKVIFNDVESRPTIVKGAVTIHDTSKKNNDAIVSILDAKTNAKIDSKSVNPQTGKYVFTVEAGTYLLTITSPGMEEYIEKLNVYDKSDYVFEIEKNVELYKPGEAPKPVAPKGNPITPVQKKKP